MLYYIYILSITYVYICIQPLGSVYRSAKHSFNIDAALRINS